MQNSHKYFSLLLWLDFFAAFNLSNYPTVPETHHSLSWCFILPFLFFKTLSVLLLERSFTSFLPLVFSLLLEQTLPCSSLPLLLYHCTFCFFASNISTTNRGFTATAGRWLPFSLSYSASKGWTLTSSPFRKLIFLPGVLASCDGHYLLRFLS